MSGFRREYSVISDIAAILIPFYQMRLDIPVSREVAGFAFPLPAPAGHDRNRRPDTIITPVRSVAGSGTERRGK
jgi:hypothetical protein